MGSAPLPSSARIRSAINSAKPSRNSSIGGGRFLLLEACDGVLCAANRFSRRLLDSPLRWLLSAQKRPILGLSSSCRSRANGLASCR